MAANANTEAERGLLSALLQGVEPGPAVSLLTAKDFFHTLHRRIFACVKSMIEQSEPLLLTAIQEKMKLDGEETARLAALLDPMLLVRSEKDLFSYVRIVKREAHLRELRHACEKVIDANGDATGLVLDLQVKTTNYIQSLREYTEAPGVLASTIAPTSVAWLWPGRIPLGKVTVIDGDPDQGKSLLTVDLIARVTSGQVMPDRTPGASGGAVLLNAEDDASDTILPRLIVADADLERVRLLKTLRTREGEREIELPGDIPTIREAALAVDAQLIVIDPLMAFLALKTNSWRDQDVRRALRPLAELAAELRAAIVVIRHLTKGDETNPLYRGGGSIGIIGAARAGLLVGTDPDDETGETRVLAVTKSNLSRKAPALRYRITPREFSIAVEWLGQCEYRASAILNNPEGEQRSHTEECRRFIESFLEDGAKPAADVIKGARAAGYSERTIDRGKVRARVEVYRAGFGKGGTWMWNTAAKDANT